ncbi:hypothetical protein RYX36_000018 [Vicia faba]
MLSNSSTLRHLEAFCGRFASMLFAFNCISHNMVIFDEGVNEVMESKGGKKKSSSSSSKSSLYEAPLDYIIEDVRPNGGVEKFKSPDYSNCTRKPS